MSDFLVNTSNTLTQGTDSGDFILANTALGSTVYGAAGDDIISAGGAINGVNAIFNGGQGTDTISLTAGVATLTVSKAVGGGGNDLLILDAPVATNATIHGGGGADTMTFSAGTYGTTTINGNGGHDFISGSAMGLSSTMFALGGGNDSLNFVSGSATNATTIAAGGGNDFISGSIVSGSAWRIEGDTVGDTDYYGNDTISLSGTVLGVSSLVQGGGGADVITFRTAFGTLSTGSTVNGNAGKDSITLGDVVASSNFLVGGGAGGDTIAITADTLDTGFGTIQGGGGADVINVSATLTGASSVIFGGEGADTIGLGATVDAGATAVNVRYTSFSESTLGANDSISATVATTGSFVLSQTVVTATTAGGLSNSEFTTDTGGLVTFTGTFAGDVTARATSLDKALTSGQAAVFADSSGTDYFFIQAGSSAGGTDDDLLVALNTGTVAASGITVAGGSAITFNLA